MPFIYSITRTRFSILSADTDLNLHFEVCTIQRRNPFVR